MANSLYAYAMQKSAQEKELRKRVMNSIDYERTKQGYPVCFKNKESFYVTELPDLSYLPSNLKQQALEGIEDKDMKQDLMAANLINWCSNTRHVLPLLVPRDGNCLLHSVSMAIWGFLDDHFVLRRLLCLALSTDKDGRFYSRWIRHRQQQISTLVNQLLVSNAESVMNEWKEIGACLDQHKSASPAVPHRFLEPIHVYTLANILRRPIVVVTDSRVRTFCGLSLQDNDMGGIYLPLEFNWSETCRTPILLGYAQSHFCPLILADPSTRLTDSRMEKKHLIPIVTKFEQMPLRFLLEGEEPEAGELLKKYLRVRETVVAIDSEFREILCAEMQGEVDHSEFNLLKEYFRLWEDQYKLQRQFKTLPVEVVFVPSSQQAQVSTSPEYHLQQVPGWMSASGTPPGYLLRPSGEQHTGLGQMQRVSRVSSPNIVVEMSGVGGIPRVSSSVPSHVPLSLQRKHGQLEENRSNSLEGRCVTPGCKYCGDPALGMMCSVCFRNYTIKDSRRNASKFVLAEQRQHPTAPFQSGITDEERFEMSMMPERCRGKCGYRCSRKTFPYCHECAETFRRQAQAKASAEAQAMTSSVAAAQVPVGTNITPSLSGALQPVIPLAFNVVTSEPTPTAISGATAGSSSLVGMPAEPVQNQACESPVNIRINESAATGGNLTSPAEALASVILVAPLTPPDDNDQDLFGSGVKSPASSNHMGNPASALTPELRQNLEQQASPALHSHQVEDNQSGPIAAVRNPPSGVTTPKLTNEPAAKCVRVGCNEAAILKKLCGKCFVSLPEGKLDESATSKMQEQSAGSIPAVLEAGQGTSSPRVGRNEGQKKELGLSLENRSCMSSLSNQPPGGEGPLNSDPAYIAQWLNGVPGMAGVNMGLPDRHGSELGEQDLIASGLGCYSSTHPCAGPQCSNQVPKANQLCKECTEILSKARRPPDPTEGAEQPQRPQLSHTVVLPASRHNPSMPQSPRPATAPMGRKGHRCIVSGCELFGDPSQNNMCSKHFWSSTGGRVQPGRTSPNAGANLVTAPPAAGSLGGGVHFAMPESMGSACYMQGSISVPPPSFPVAESEAGSGHGDFAGLNANVKLAEVYKRLMPWPDGVPKCSMPGCGNYASKNGMCNSCYNSSLSSEEARRYAVLGEEQIG